MAQTKESLMAFSERVKDAFLSKKIKHPVHLSGGNEDELIEIFKDIYPQDWVISTWRNSYHALLKGVPEDELFDAIVSGRGMYFMDRERHILCSSIVGGTLPIACGIAMGIRRKGLPQSVFVFVGDMCARTGHFHEFLSYCDGHSLPVKVIIEDNGYSTNTVTDEVWGSGVEYQASTIHITRYRYERKWPHVGVGEHVQF